MQRLDSDALIVDANEKGLALNMVIELGVVVGPLTECPALILPTALIGEQDTCLVY